ncbi:hypothetical protein E2562_036705 [Oryza meyeriana var. granulata]|uniref:Uncharacterized protein n=1 Tax=Oryza meyeriana var. granulata TaxID=110450 RepID=A0A6G1CL44_9ORYZ|nr:hypothetical protein E2562_036705 [Oryza meyeriana var. granulata]
MVTDAQKRVMRKLGFTAEDEKITRQAQDEYSKFFDNPLCDGHIAALAAIFGWSLEEANQVSTGDGMSSDS